MRLNLKKTFWSALCFCFFMVLAAGSGCEGCGGRSYYSEPSEVSDTLPAEKQAPVIEKEEPIVEEFASETEEEEREEEEVFESETEEESAEAVEEENNESETEEE